MNAMNDYLDGLLEGPSGLTISMSLLGPILSRDKLGIRAQCLKCPRIVYMPH